MKKLFLMLFLGMTLSVSAQQEGERGGQMRERQRQGMMQGRQQKEIEVAPEHKEAFEALKKEYAEAKKEVYAKCHGEMPQRGEKPTEEQMDTRMKNHMACQKALVELQEKYYPKFRKMLNPFQAAQVLELWGNNNGFQRQNAGPGQGGQRGPRRN